MAMGVSRSGSQVEAGDGPVHHSMVGDDVFELGVLLCSGSSPLSNK